MTSSQPFVFIQALSASLCLAVALNGLGRRGGFSGMRGVLSVVALSAALGSFSLLGASLETAPERILRWHIGVRVGLAGIGSGGVGAALILLRPGAPRLLGWVFGFGGLAAAIGAYLVTQCTPEQLVRTQVSWFLTATSVRIYDTLAIVVGSMSVMGAALYELKKGNAYGRRTMRLLIGAQLGVAVTYFLVRVWGPPPLMQAFGVALTSISALLFWAVLHDYRMAGTSSSAYMLAFRSSPQPVVLLDLHTETPVLNEAAVALLGRAVSAREILRRLGFSGTLEAFLAEHGARPLTGLRLAGRDEKVFDVQVHLDATQGLSLIQLNDVTDRVAHAQTLQRSLEEREAMHERLLLHEKMAALGVLVAGVSHEINNPLAYVSSNVSTAREALVLLQEGATLAREAVARESVEGLRAWAQRRELLHVEEDGLGALDDAVDGCARIKQLVASMRLFTRQEETEVSEDLVELARSGVRIGRVGLPPGVRLVEELAGPLPVRGLPGELTRIVTNLVVNAGQAVGAQGTIWVRGFEEEAQVVVEVCDDGPGIPAELRARIFDPFFTTKAPGKGTGLGLSISFEIARRHGGELLLVDRPEGGACFQLRLPRAPSEPEALQASASSG